MNIGIDIAKPLVLFDPKERGLDNYKKLAKDMWYNIVKPVKIDTGFYIPDEVEYFITRQKKSALVHFCLNAKIKVVIPEEFKILMENKYKNELRNR